MMFITHAMPRNLLVDEVVRIGHGALSAVSDAHDETKQKVEGGAHW
jgi:subfamily B ATP-binding cassette protein HlyB/CyaB